MMNATLQEKLDSIVGQPIELFRGRPADGGIGLSVNGILHSREGYYFLLSERCVIFFDINSVLRIDVDSKFSKTGLEVILK